MRRRADPEYLAAELVELWAAPTAEELYRVLVLHPPEQRGANAFEPYQLLSKHHEIDPTSSAVTAMLLVTDPRWRDGAGDLIRQIEQSGMLDDDQLDLLAEAFLAAGKALFWAVPDHWFSETGIVIDFGEVEEADDEAVVETEQAVVETEEVHGPTVARREVYLPLRRWAAGRLVGRRPESWGRVLARTGEVDARSGAAVMLGLLDVVDILKPSVQELLIEKSVRWPNHSVRRLGIGLVAERKGVEAAYALAQTDPNAGVRKWSASLVAVSAEPESPTLF